ncbi:MAG: UvrD-helicase domain-containing protein [Tannerellaceae bacterium]|jgi:DNA helicase-2/ATP-dependent DNA helicase PcrA|nr:UvrD-helicase domain-containing protein [Tannerellaceae bacterium]
MENYLSQLNESQREAVLYTGGPELIIAGAGSGKTRVLTCKIAHLLQSGIAPYRILALTFTNKAAREMKERIALLVEPSLVRRLWMGTFHAIFSRILHREAERIGYPPQFTIYDGDDSKSLLKSVIGEMSLPDRHYRPVVVQKQISRAKNALVSCNAYAQDRELMQQDLYARMPLIGDIYQRYQNRCVLAGAMDFDDLLLQTHILFRDHPDVLESYQRSFQYILVDEYQDTNFAQHFIVQRLSEIHRHVCVVGDDAQSIYSFRGANLDNILQFKNQYPGCRVFKLEQNYRSTQTLVKAANSLIRKNTKQIPKTVYSEKNKGGKIRLTSAYSDYEEAYVVASRVAEMKMGKEGYTYADFAVLYRVNAQSRRFEEVFLKRNIPYKIYGGFSFYNRKEVKDVIAYLRLIVNPNDEEALKRIINYPQRGIGHVTTAKLIAAATQHNVSLWSVLKKPEAHDEVKISSGILRKITDFRKMIEGFIKKNEELMPDEMAAQVMKQAGILADVMQEDTPDADSRVENLKELLNAIYEYVHLHREEGDEQASLANYLSTVSLLTDQDNDKDANADKVTLMTIHAAKGLEFKNVFIVGLEEDLFPSLLSKGSAHALEEERRLFYVALTRAEENCMLTYAQSRFMNGKSVLCSPSRFLRDIDSQYMDSPGLIPGPAGGIERKYDTPPSPAQPPVLLPEFEQLQTGATVKHDRFGKGIILAIEGEGNNTKATVEFENLGQKQLLLKFARLTIV